MLSLQRRVERYKIIYTWKILKEMVPNCGINQVENARFIRLCQITPIKKCQSKIQILRENSFQIIGPKLINLLPAKIRNLSKCSFLLQTPD